MNRGKGSWLSLFLAMACVVLLFSVSLFVGTSYGAEVALMGPQPFLRTTGQPNIYSATFLGRPGTGTLLIQNGDSSGQVRVIALIIVNGTQVVGGSNFDAPYTSKAVPVTLARDNSISIELRGEPKNSLTVTVLEEINCTALDQCHVAGTWDRTLGECTNPATSNGTTCNDGNVCTQTDTCQSGFCVGTNPVVCQAMDQCHIAGVCDPSSGCSNPAASNGTTCNDGNVCTQTDACQSGFCVGTNPLVCQAMDQCHIAGVCDPSSGCSNPAAPNGITCNDGNACTQKDSCQTGVCVGSAITCDDNNYCTADTCDPAVGCVQTDQRTAITISPTLTRYSLTSPDGRVGLYEDHACNQWFGWYLESMEPEVNYCGPTAGMNVLGWYGVPSDYGHLGSQMRTNNWMGTNAELIAHCTYNCLLEPTCTAACYLIKDYLIEVGTLPEDVEKTLAEHSPPGYQLGRFRGNPGLDTIEDNLREGRPIVVLIWTGSRLHWTVVTGTYEDNGTVLVRFANADVQTWDWFVHQWSFEGLNPPGKTMFGWYGVDDYVWMRYEKTTMLTEDQAIWVGQENALYSEDGRFMFFLDTAGHLVLYPTPLILGTDLWHSNNAVISNAAVAWMQTDGNLVIRDEDMNAVWQSNTHDHPGAYLAIQNDGNLVIYDADHRTVLWASDTCCH